MISKSESGSINLNRYGTVFRTDKNYYFYDTGTGKVLRCEKPVYQLLKHTFTEGALDKSTLALSDEEIEKAFNDIDFAIEKEKILSAKEVKNFRINSMRFQQRCTSRQILIWVQVSRVPIWAVQIIRAALMTAITQ